MYAPVNNRQVLFPYFVLHCLLVFLAVVCCQLVTLWSCVHTKNMHVSEGEWCETETDECRTATCSPITDCVDLIGAYRCDLNPTKMTAIILCALLAVLLVVLAVFKLKKRSSKVGLWYVYSSFCLLSSDIGGLFYI